MFFVIIIDDALLISVGEDPVYSQPVTLNLDNLFTHIYLDSCTEMSLTANQPV